MEDTPYRSPILLSRLAMIGIGLDGFLGVADVLLGIALIAAPGYEIPLEAGTSLSIWFVAIGLMGWILAALIGAVAGFLLMLFLFDWGLILLTSWAGANAVVGKVTGLWSAGATIATIIFLALLAAGIFVQAGQMKAKK